MSSIPFDQAPMLSSLLHSLEDSVYFKDKTGHFLLVNAALVRAVRESSIEGVLGRTDADFFGKAHAEAAYADEQEIMRTGQARLHYQEKEIFDDGTVHWCSTSKYPLLDARGEVIGIFGISRDITAQKIAEAQLAESNKELLVTERRLAVVDFSELILFHMKQMADVAESAVHGVTTAIQSGNFVQIKKQVEALITAVHPESPAMQELINLLGEIEIESERQGALHTSLATLQQELGSIIELVELRKNFKCS